MIWVLFFLLLLLSIKQTFCITKLKKEVLTLSDFKKEALKKIYDQSYDNRMLVNTEKFLRSQLYDYSKEVLTLRCKVKELKNKVIEKKVNKVIKEDKPSDLLEILSYKLEISVLKDKITKLENELNYKKVENSFNLIKSIIDEKPIKKEVKKASYKRNSESNKHKRVIVPIKIRLEIFNRDKVCLNCGTNKNLSIDHIVPVCKGGTNDIQNLQTLCLKCNIKKQDKIIDYRKQCLNSS